jgi:hypothetical protein
MMPLGYFKRYRMEADLTNLPPVPDLPQGYVWLPWNDVWLETHAEVKYLSFHEERDSKIFPHLSSLEGCLLLMHCIREKPGFCPGATWLIASLDGYCGTIQGLRDPKGLGAIQNLGVIDEYRGLGLGKALLIKSLHGFRTLGLTRAMLEVTAENELAIELYEKLGFRRRKTIYKPVLLPSKIELASSFH